jgi:hypothetical protein
MFDPVGAFTRQFTPVEGGYLYYPSRRSGGKLVSASEYEMLVADWRRIAAGGTWKVAGFLILVIVVGTIASRTLAVPDWMLDIAVFGAIAAISIGVLWVGGAPRRLVRERPAITPPRPIGEAQRDSRRLMKWPFVLVMIVIWTRWFLLSFDYWQGSFGQWAWTIASGLGLGYFLWIGFQKFRDRSD